MCLLTLGCSNLHSFEILFHLRNERLAVFDVIGTPSMRVRVDALVALEEVEMCEAEGETLFADGDRLEHACVLELLVTENSNSRPEQTRAAETITIQLSNLTDTNCLHSPLPSAAVRVCSYTICPSYCSWALFGFGFTQRM